MPTQPPRSWPRAGGCPPMMRAGVVMVRRGLLGWSDACGPVLRTNTQPSYTTNLNMNDTPSTTTAVPGGNVR